MRTSASAASVALSLALWSRGERTRGISRILSCEMHLTMTNNPINLDRRALIRSEEGDSFPLSPVGPVFRA
jgi:hypothetical protein